MPALKLDDNAKVSDNEFIAVRVKVAVLKRMLQEHSLHVCDLQCASKKQKAKLHELLLQALLENFNYKCS
jgi:hypothetical protein